MDRGLRKARSYSVRLVHRYSPCVPLVLACVGLLNLPLALHAQQARSGVIAGTVLTADSERPLEAAAVHLIGSGERWLARTDAGGHFRFEGVPPGLYRLSVSLIGRLDHASRIQVEADRETAVVVALGLQPVPVDALNVLLDRTRLVPPGRELPGSAQVLGAEELQKQHIAFGDVHKALFRLPGVNIQEEEGYGLRPNIGLRGTGSERSSKITLMEDGILIAPAPYAAPAAYYFPVMGRMEAVEVRKGSSQIKYGPRTIGGALNLVSKSIPSRLDARAAFTGGEKGTAKLVGTIGDSYRNFGWLGQGFVIRTGGFKELDGGGSTGFDLQDFLFKLRVNTDPDAPVYQAWTVKLGFYDQTSDETYLGLTDEDFAATPNRRYAASQQDVFNGDHQQYQLQHFIQPSDALNVVTTVYRNDFARNWFKLQSVLGTGIGKVMSDPAAFPEELAILKGAASEDNALEVRANNRDYYSQGVQSVLGIQAKTGAALHAIEFGARYHADAEDRFQKEDGFRMEGGRMLLTSVGAPGSESNRVSSAAAWSFYAQDEIALGDWTLIPGLRYETVDFRRVDYAKDDPGRTEPVETNEHRIEALIPGISVEYRASGAVGLFAGVHKGFGPPGASASEETKPEESINYELGARFWREGLRAELVGFFSDYGNTLGRATLANSESGSGEIFNGGEVDVLGLELLAEFDPLAAGGGSLSLPIRITYTFTDAEFRTSFDSGFEPWGSVEIGEKLPYIAPHQLLLAAGLVHSRWYANVDVRVQSAMRTVAGQGRIPVGEGTDSYAVLGLQAEYELTRRLGWSVFVAVENLTDAAYIVARRPAGPRPGLPRTVSLGIRVNN